MRTSSASGSVKYQWFIQLPFFQNLVHMQCIIRHDGSWSTRVSQPVIRLHSKNLCLWNHMPYKSVPKNMNHETWIHCCMVWRIVEAGAGYKSLLLRRGKNARFSRCAMEWKKAHAWRTRGLFSHTVSEKDMGSVWWPEVGLIGDAGPNKTSVDAFSAAILLARQKRPI